MKKRNFIIIIIVVVFFVFVTKKIVESQEAPIFGVLTEKNNKSIEANKEELAEIINMQSIFRKIADLVIPTIVSITSEHIDTETDYYDYENTNTKYLGSGVIISEDGYIITSNHLIKNSKKIYVTLPNKKEYLADVIGADSNSDIAVLKINAGEVLAVAYLGDSDTIRVGDFAIAIGNPFGLNSSFTLGIISAVDRNINPKSDIYYIQTDASINTGNSGGALVNINGQVIGINTSIFSIGYGNNIGIGFAIPINNVKKIALDIVNNGFLEETYLGIILGEDIITTQSYILRSDEGVNVISVYNNSPADKSGIKKDDVLIEIGNRKIKNKADYIKALLNLSVGDKVFVKTRRGKDIIVSEVLVEKKPKVKRHKTSNFLGIVVDKIDKLYENIEYPKDTKGVVVVGIEKGSPAEIADIKEGDIITEIDYKPINSLENYTNTIENLNKTKSRYVFSLKYYKN